jgi:hypothetical protein
MRKHGEKIYKSSSYRYRQLFTKVPCTQTTKLSLRYINRKHLDDLGRHLKKALDQVSLFILRARGSEFLTGSADVCLRVQGLQDSESQASCWR